MRQRPYGKTMSLDRKIAERRRLVSRVGSIFSDTAAFHRTSDVHRDRIKTAIYDDPAYKLLSISDREYLRGVIDTLHDQQWRSMVWRLGPETGPLPEHEDGWKVPSCCLVAIKLKATKCPICYHDLRDGSSCILGDLSRTPNALYGGHFWPGTDIPFTEYKCINRPHCKSCHHDDVLHVDGGRCTDPYHKDGQCPCEAFVKV